MIFDIMSLFSLWAAKYSNLMKKNLALLEKILDSAYLQWVESSRTPMACSLIWFMESVVLLSRVSHFKIYKTKNNTKLHWYLKINKDCLIRIKIGRRGCYDLGIILPWLEKTLNVASLKCLEMHTMPIILTLNLFMKNVH